MTHIDLDIQPQRTLLLLLTFTWGEANVATYCRATDQITIGAVTYAPLTQIECDVSQQQGLAKEAQPVALTMPLVSPLIELTTEPCWATVWCRIEEVDPAATADRRTIWYGYISSSTRNPGGRTGLVKVFLSGWRQRLNVPVGICALSTCAWALGDANCGANLAAIQQVTTVNAVAGAQLTMASSGWTHDGSIPWQLGEVYYDGLAIAIRKWDVAVPLVLQLYRQAPSTWLGKSARLTPGCAKTPAACAAFDNLQRFGGIGLKMPDHNPLFEVPG